MQKNRFVLYSLVSAPSAKRRLRPLSQARLRRSSQSQPRRCISRALVTADISSSPRPHQTVSSADCPGARQAARESRQARPSAAGANSASASGSQMGARAKSGTPHICSKTGSPLQPLTKQRSEPSMRLSTLTQCQAEPARPRRPKRNSAAGPVFSNRSL